MSDKQPAIIRSNAPRMVQVEAGSLNAKGKNNFINPAEAAGIEAPDLEKIKNELKSHLEALEHLKDTHKNQSIHTNDEILSNTQKVKTDLFEEHNLKVAVDQQKNNIQSLNTTNENIDHIETLTSEEKNANLQKIKSDQTQANLQSIEESAITDHTETLSSQKSTSLNQAKLDAAIDNKDNKQLIDGGGSSSNHQMTKDNGTDKNSQKISTIQIHDENIGIDTDAIDENKQKIETTQSKNNLLDIKENKQDLNVQAVEEQLSLDKNNQKIDDESNSTNKVKISST